MWYKRQYNYICFKSIQISSQVIGSIWIPDLDDIDRQGYEIIGKIDGCVEYTGSMMGMGNYGNGDGNENGNGQEGDRME